MNTNLTEIETNCACVREECLQVRIGPKTMLHSEAE